MGGGIEAVYRGRVRMIEDLDAYKQSMERFPGDLLNG